MRWSDFERTLVWSGVTFERTLVWSKVILSAQSSRRWSGFRLGHGRKIVWTMVWFWSDQRCFPSGKVWSETVSSALRAHTVFGAHFSLIRGYFGLGWSDQRLLSSGTVWSEVTSVWPLNLGMPAITHNKFTNGSFPLKPPTKCLPHYTPPGNYSTPIMVYLSHDLGGGL